MRTTLSSKRALGRWWKRLHRYGMHHLWAFFLASYALELRRAAPAGRVLFGAAVVALLSSAALRLAMWARAGLKRDAKDRIRAERGS
jgi:hypothetical protein